MRRIWTIHCHPNGCYWECITELVSAEPKIVRSRVFENRTLATLDAHRHGMDPDDSGSVIVRKNYLEGG